MAQQEVLIPDIGDAEDVEVIEILASVGAQIAIDDPLIVIESDKASMEVPATVAGKLRKITVALGDKVREGQVVAIVEVRGRRRQRCRKSRQRRAAQRPGCAATGCSSNGCCEGTDNSQAGRTADATVRRFEVRIPDIGDAKDVIVVEVAVKPGKPSRSTICSSSSNPTRRRWRSRRRSREESSRSTSAKAHRLPKAVCSS